MLRSNCQDARRNIKVNQINNMIVVIIKTVVLTLCILAVLLMFFRRKYDFCIWEKGKINSIYICDHMRVYDRFMHLVNADNTGCRSRIELDFEDNVADSWSAVRIKNVY